MLDTFPKQIANRGIYLYVGALTLVTAFYFRHSMDTLFIIMGLVWVTGFFLLTRYCTIKWRDFAEKRIMLYMFFTALLLRVIWVFISYNFYYERTGMPFEFDAGDAIWYYEESVNNISTSWKDIWNYLFVEAATVSDSGYVLYLTLLHKIMGPSIIWIRLINSVFSSLTCVLVYLLAKRNIGRDGARIAAIFCCFMPNMVFYCGLHLKESVMLFLLTAFLERTDYLLRSRKYNVITIATPIVLALILFTFRTVLGAAAVFSVATALVFTNTTIVGNKKRFMLIGWGLLAVTLLAGGTIMSEIENTWENRFENQTAKRAFQSSKGNQWAQYATGTVMAPMMFVLPFPTMVDVDRQYNQQMLHGGNFVRNFLGGFVLIAMFNALFITKNWRNLTLIGSFVVAYLGIISLSGFANSERFLLPGLPVLLIMAASGVNQLDAKSYRFIKIWYWVVPVMSIAWAVFKLGSRGML